MQLAYPQQESEEAREGTASHEVAAYMLRQSLAGGGAYDPPAVGAVASNGVVLTREMIEAAETYVDDVLANRPPGARVNIEERVPISRIHEQCWGTPDAWAWSEGMRTLTLWDYKYGHKFVPAFENWQMIPYICGILDSLKVKGLEEIYITVEVRIVQPRHYSGGGPVRIWRVPPSDLRAHVNKLTTSAAEALNPHPSTRAGPWCDNCTARHACETLRRAAARAMDIAGSAIPEDLPPHALGLELRNLKKYRDLLDARITGLQAEAEALLRSGTPVPFWGLAPTRSREDWTVTPAEVFALGDMLGHDLRRPPEPVTPNQAKKLGVSADIVSAYATANTGVKLVEDDGTKARQVFS